MSDTYFVHNKSFCSCSFISLAPNYCNIGTRSVVVVSLSL